MAIKIYRMCGRRRSESFCGGRKKKKKVEEQWEGGWTTCRIFASKRKQKKRGNLEDVEKPGVRTIFGEGFTRECREIQLKKNSKQPYQGKRNQGK